MYMPETRGRSLEKYVYVSIIYIHHQVLIGNILTALKSTSMGLLKLSNGLPFWLLASIGSGIVDLAAELVHSQTGLAIPSSLITSQWSVLLGTNIGTRVLEWIRNVCIGICLI